MQTSPTLAQKIAANRLDRAYRAPAAAPAATEDDLVDSTKLFSSNTWAEDTGKVKNPVTTLKSSLTKCMSFLPRGTKEPLPTGGTILQVGQHIPQAHRGRGPALTPRRPLASVSLVSWT